MVRGMALLFDPSNPSWHQRRICDKRKHVSPFWSWRLFVRSLPYICWTSYFHASFLFTPPPSDKSCGKTTGLPSHTLFKAFECSLCLSINLTDKELIRTDRARTYASYTVWWVHVRQASDPAAGVSSPAGLQSDTSVTCVGWTSWRVEGVELGAWESAGRKWTGKRRDNFFPRPPALCPLFHSLWSDLLVGYAEGMWDEEGKDISSQWKRNGRLVSRSGGSFAFPFIP